MKKKKILSEKRIKISQMDQIQGMRRFIASTLKSQKRQTKLRRALVTVDDALNSLSLTVEY